MLSNKKWRNQKSQISIYYLVMCTHPKATKSEDCRLKGSSERERNEIAFHHRRALWTRQPSTNPSHNSKYKEELSSESMSSLSKKAHSGSHINEYLSNHHALKHINDPVSEMWPKYSEWTLFLPDNIITSLCHLLLSYLKRA